VTENTIKNFIKLSRDIDDAGNLTDAGQIVAHIGTTKTFNVTVTTKTAAHRYNGSGSGNGYVIDGVEAPHIELLPDVTYRFDQSDSSNSGHPLLFYYEADKTTQYSTGVVTNGTPGSAGAYTEISVTDSTPSALYYQCSAHAYMGNAVSTPPSKNLTVGGDVTAVGVTASGNVTAVGVTASGNVTAVGVTASGTVSGATVTSTGDVNDSVSNVRTPRITNITSTTTIANEGVYYVLNNPTVTLGSPATGTIMTLYISSASSMTLARGSTVVWLRKGADNDTVSHASVTLGAYSTATITFLVLLSQ